MIGGIGLRNAAAIQGSITLTGKEEVVITQAITPAVIASLNKEGNPGNEKDEAKNKADEKRLKLKHTLWHCRRLSLQRLHHSY